MDPDRDRCIFPFALYIYFIGIGLGVGQCKLTYMVYSHWLSPGLGQGLELGHGWMGCMSLCRTFHTAPEQGQRRMGFVPIFQVLKLFQVVCFNDILMSLRYPVPDTAGVNSFCILSVPDTASVITLLVWVGIRIRVRQYNQAIINQEIHKELVLFIKINGCQRVLYYCTFLWDSWV